MSAGLAFWILMLIWLVFGVFVHFWPTPGWGVVGNSVLIFVLFLLLGWKVFGAPLHG